MSTSLNYLSRLVKYVVAIAQLKFSLQVFRPRAGTRKASSTQTSPRYLCPQCDDWKTNLIKVHFPKCRHWATPEEIEQLRRNPGISEAKTLTRAAQLKPQELARNRIYQCPFPVCADCPPRARIREYHFKVVHGIADSAERSRLFALSAQAASPTCTEKPTHVTAEEVGEAFRHYRNSPEGGAYVDQRTVCQKRQEEQLANIKKSSRYVVTMLTMALGGKPFQVSLVLFDLATQMQSDPTVKTLTFTLLFPAPGNEVPD